MATAPRTRSNLQPENVDDDDHGQGRDGGGAADRDDDGVGDELSEQEMEALSNMRTGERDGAGREEPEPAGDQDGDGDGDADADADADADGVDDDAAAAAAGERDAGARDDRGKQGDQSQQRAPKTINYGRHQREITKRETRLAELTGLLDKERIERTRLDERTKMLLEAINARPKAEEPQQQQDDDPEPDKGEDPIGWGEWKIRKLEGVVNRLDGAQRQQQERTQAETEEQREINDYTAELQAAVQRDETVGQAFVHLRESRYAELGAIYAGIDVNNPEECATLTPVQQVQLSRQIQEAFASEQRMVYRAAKQSNRSVAQSIIALAKARGYNPAARQRAADQDQGQDDGAQQRQPARRQAPQGQQRAVTRPAPARSVSEEIDNIREAAGASKSLSDAGGSPGGDIDVKRVAEMDDDEFMDFLSSMPKNKLDRIMGK